MRFARNGLSSWVSLFLAGYVAENFPVTQGKLYKFEKVADGICYASGGTGSNNVVIVNRSQDVFLVDDGTTPATARALFPGCMRLITNKPRFARSVNTHFHYDHTDGNCV